MPLFPNIEQCQLAIHNFPQDQAQILNGVFHDLVQNGNNQALLDVETRVVRLLKRWNAHRGQRAPLNVNFVQSLIQNDQAVASLFEIVNVTSNTTSLNLILGHEQSIRLLYDSLKALLLSNDVPARIMTVSKCLLMLTGFTVGLDTRVRKKIQQAYPYALTCSGVWPFYLYLETLKLIAIQQDEWQQHNGSMSNLLPGVPIGQIMDRILW
jgi:hypothetical protein